MAAGKPQRCGGKAIIGPIVRVLSSFCLIALAAAGSFGAQGGQTQSKPGEAAPPKAQIPSEPGLYAVIHTSMGDIVCRLFEKEAPKTVANFVGLATGSKRWRDPESGAEKHKPLYTGTTFHRVIPGFMIQGGDPTGTGSGGPGYEFEDEIDPNLKFDRAGLLAMANSGPNTNGSQFFITVAPAPHLDSHYSIFGEVVAGQDVADHIADVPRNSDDKPLEPVHISSITVRRVGAPKADVAGREEVR